MDGGSGGVFSWITSSLGFGSTQPTYQPSDEELFWPWLVFYSIAAVYGSVLVLVTFPVAVKHGLRSSSSNKNSVGTRNVDASGSRSKGRPIAAAATSPAERKPEWITRVQQLKEERIKKEQEQKQRREEEQRAKEKEKKELNNYSAQAREEERKRREREEAERKKREENERKRREEEQRKRREEEEKRRREDTERKRKEEEERKKREETERKRREEEQRKIRDENERKRREEDDRRRREETERKRKEEEERKKREETERKKREEERKQREENERKRREEEERKRREENERKRREEEERKRREENERKRREEEQRKQREETERKRREEEQRKKREEEERIQRQKEEQARRSSLLSLKQSEATNSSPSIIVFKTDNNTQQQQVSYKQKLKEKEEQEKATARSSPASSVASPSKDKEKEVPSNKQKTLLNVVSNATVQEGGYELSIIQFPNPKTYSANVDIGTLWRDFVAEEEMLTTLQIFNELKRKCAITDEDSSQQIYAAIATKTQSLNHSTAALYKLLDRRRASIRSLLSSSSASSSPLKVLVIGGGPGGLRTAVEASLMGAEVIILEKRAAFSRHNLLHIWDSSIHDLKNVGAKFFFPKFCTGGIHHIAIRRLQTLLLKVCLILGVKFFPMVTFKGLFEMMDGSGWRLETESMHQLNPKELAGFNVLVGADGENSVVADVLGFQRKLTKGSQAIGITANFVNSQTRPEKQIEEFGRLRVYHQSFFQEFQDKYDIELENLVYYRGETHYFVMTAKKQSLLSKGVLKNDCADAADFLNPQNINKDALETFVREVAVNIKLPATCSFAANSRGGKDVAIFDFSSKKVSTANSKILQSSKNRSNQLLICLVGDALVEPFWPLGTGANRAILAALDATWMMKRFQEERGRTAPEELLKEWAIDFKIMMVAEEKDLNPRMQEHTINPASRYVKNTLNHFH
ncbi:[F-actin]-monooxygenase mical3 [Balamuthia mandrillaris]